MQLEVRELIKRYGPELGDLYYKEEVSWDKVVQRVRTLENAEQPEEDRPSPDGASEGPPARESTLSAVESSTRLEEQASAFSVIPDDDIATVDISDDLSCAESTTFMEEESDVLSKKNK